MENENSTPQAQAQEAIAPPQMKKGSKVRRLTPDQSKRIYARLAEECAKNTPGAQIRAKLNLEFGVNLCRQAYEDRIIRLGLRAGGKQCLRGDRPAQMDADLAQMITDDVPRAEIVDRLNEKYGLQWSLDT